MAKFEYVLLYYANEYSQLGGYFLGIFSTREKAEAEIEYKSSEDYQIKKIEVNKYYGVIDEPY